MFDTQAYLKQYIEIFEKLVNPSESETIMLISQINGAALTGGMESILSLPDPLMFSSESGKIFTMELPINNP
jgi:hypothetical protein